MFSEFISAFMNKSVLPQIGNYCFKISRLDPGILTKGQYGYNRYGYTILGGGHHEGGGAYNTPEAATRACLARIETLCFDTKHPARNGLSWTEVEA